MYRDFSRESRAVPACQKALTGGETGREKKDEDEDEEEEEADE